MYIRPKGRRTCVLALSLLWPGWVSDIASCTIVRNEALHDRLQLACQLCIVLSSIGCLPPRKYQQPSELNLSRSI